MCFMLFPKVLPPVYISSLFAAQGFNRFILIVKQACLCNFDVVLKLLEPSWKWLEMKQKFECSIQMSNYILTQRTQASFLSFLERVQAIREIFDGQNKERT